MNELFQNSMRLISLSTNALGISCNRDENVLRIEIDLNTLIYAAFIFTSVSLFIFGYNLIKEKFIHPKSSADILN